MTDWNGDSQLVRSTLLPRDGQRGDYKAVSRYIPEDFKEIAEPLKKKLELDMDYIGGMHDVKLIAVLHIKRA